MNANCWMFGLVSIAACSQHGVSTNTWHATCNGTWCDRTRHAGVTALQNCDAVAFMHHRSASRKDLAF